MKVRIFREAETVDVLGGHSLREAVMQPPPDFAPFGEMKPLICEHHEYPIRIMVKAKQGQIMERHNIVFADELVNELLDNQQWEAAFYRDMVKGREKESKLLGDELKHFSAAIRDKDAEIGRLGMRVVWSRRWAWIWAGVAVGLLIALGVVVFL